MSTAVTILPNGELAPTSSAPAQPRVDPATGRIQGIDGMLGQIAGALAREAAPVIRAELLPVILQNQELQRNVGYAAGRGMGEVLARKMWPYAAVATAALLAIAAIEYERYCVERDRARE